MKERKHTGKRLADLLKSAYCKYREVLWYLVCGAGTTIVNLVVFWACGLFPGMSTAASTSAAWLFAVIFAYITNRTFVFRSQNHTLQAVGKEIAAFFGARICSGILDVALMVFLVDVMHFPSMWMKIFVNVLVTILNYVFSKWVIFRSGEEKRHVSDTVVSQE